jgi:hypothetical protein
MNFKFRLMPSYLVRLIGESLKMLSNSVFVISSQSLDVNCNSSFKGSNAGSVVGDENLFHGQTS